MWLAQNTGFFAGSGSPERAPQSAVASAHGVEALPPWPWRLSAAAPEPRQPAAAPKAFNSANGAGLDQFERVWRKALRAGRPPSRSYIVENQRPSREAM